MRNSIWRSGDRIFQLPVQSFRDLLRHLATMVKNRIEPMLKSIPPFDMITPP